jgi:hypothetical protein
MINYIPLIILGVLSCIGLGITIAKHGDADKNNAWTSLISVILSWILILWFLLINELL